MTGRRALVDMHVVTPMTRSFVLRLYCPTCHGGITVQCEPEDSSAGPQGITCPYCQHEYRVDLNARVLWVSTGHLPRATT
jgi:hypothetical protein